MYIGGFGDFEGAIVLQLGKTDTCMIVMERVAIPRKKTLNWLKKMKLHK